MIFNFINRESVKIKYKHKVSDTGSGEPLVFIFPHSQKVTFYFFITLILFLKNKVAFNVLFFYRFSIYLIYKFKILGDWHHLDPSYLENCKMHNKADGIHMTEIFLSTSVGKKTHTNQIYN
jgi:hypothetical protein